MQHIAWFKNLSKDSIETAGGKGANLGEMYNAGLPVPPGFVVTAQTYKFFIEKTKIKEDILNFLKNLDIEDTDRLQATAKNIQKLIISTQMPDEIKSAVIDAYETLSIKEGNAQELIKPEEHVFVAARSSATAEDLPEASFAGQQATYLNVRGDDKITRAVQKCWASLFTARAIYYRVKNNFPHEKVFIAVVVQKMVNSDKAGVMFSVNPATNNPDEIVIEAAFGLGESVVSGAVNPDLYIIDKKTNNITKTEIKEQKIKIIRDPETGENITKKMSPKEEKEKVLNDKEIYELARLARKIEEYYKKPQDMEWAVEGDKIYIVQARAVTTFKSAKAEKETAVKEKGVIVKGETASRGIASGTVKIVLKMEDLDKIKKGDILVTTMTTPDMVPAMQRAAAIVTDEGGLTCHAAIVSREMGTPCIVGAGDATKVLKEGDIITVNATHGNVYPGKTEIKEQISKKPFKKISTKTKIKIMTDLPDYAEKSAATGADGVGLVRIEIMIAQGKVHPAEYMRQNRREDYIKLLMNGIGKIAEAFKNKPVWIRTSDLRTDEYRNLEGGDKEPEETDPMIGWHAIRRALDEPEILKAEFEAVKRLHEKGLKNIGVMIPFVIRTREIRKAKEILRDIGLEPQKDIEFGVMIETPASCWIIEDICKEGIDFISFGTNDLTQLTLGIDRNNERIQKLYDEMHEAVLGQIAKVIRTCKKYNVETSICGQAGSRPEMAKFLVKHGIDSISANADAVQDIREIVAKVEKN
ncbi:phosphoenolpyruvate synthase [Candidatus Woesearchaeota archaeon]|nr:phosphoenolpyruvate synthase [Candidatus Woesearchaeota archaeon]